MAKGTQKAPAKSSATRSASVSAWQSARTPEARSESARKAAATRAVNRAAGSTAATPSDARRYVFTRTDGTKVRVSAAEKARREKLQAAALARKGLVRVETTRGPRFLPPAEAAKRKAAVERGRVRASLTRAESGLEPPTAPAAQEPPPAGPVRWQSSLTYIRGTDIGDLRAWLEDLLDAAEEDAKLDGVDPYATPWYVSGGMESESGLSSVFAVVADGTRGQRGSQVMKAAVTALADAAPGEGIDPRYADSARGRSQGRAAYPLDDAARAAAAAARAKFAGPKEEVRIETQITPVYPGDPAVPTTSSGDDDDEVPF